MRVGVIGLGLMGSGIAEVCARAGHDVRVVETSAGTLAAGLERVQRSLQRAVERSKLDAGSAAAVRSRIEGVADVAALEDRDLVIEAASEDEVLKLDLFRRLGEVAAADAVLASNTSAIPIARLAEGTAHPGRVIGLHFFNPAPVMKLVEVIPSDATSAATIARTDEFVLSLGKSPVHAPDRPGFIVNALLIPFLLDAMRMLERGDATRDDIDTGMRLGCAHPMGPLELADFAGLDTVAAAAATLRLDVPGVLRDKVAAGQLGRKSGQGFYNYPAA